MVEIASGVDDIVMAIERLLTRPKQAWLARVDQRLRGMSWDATWARMQSLLHDCVGKAQQFARKEDHRLPDNRL